MTDEIKKKVDTDWKRQVEAERAKIVKEQQTQASETSRSSTTEAPPIKETSQHFVQLISGIATEAMMCLGVIPMPNGQTGVDLDHAQAVIDTLDALEKKTKGNLSQQEEELLKQALQELKMAFVKLSGKMKPPKAK